MRSDAHRQPLIVAIVGGSGSGKTWLARRLQRFLGRRAGILSLDDFYRDLSALPMASRVRTNFDHPNAIDWDLLLACLRKIQQGEKTPLPRYDFTTHTRRPQPRLWRPHRVVLVDGLWLLRRRELRRSFALSVFVDCPNALRLERRMARDVRERGRIPDSVRRQFHEHVEPMHRRYVEPQRRWATCQVVSPISNLALRRLLADVRTAATRSEASSCARSESSPVCKQRIQPSHEDTPPDRRCGRSRAGHTPHPPRG